MSKSKSVRPATSGHANRAGMALRCFANAYSGKKQQDGPLTANLVIPNKNGFENDP